MSSMSRSSSDPAERSSSPAPSSPSSSASVSYARPSPTDVGLPPRVTSSFAGPSSREGAAAGGRDDTRDDRSGRRERTLGFPLDDASSPVAPSSLGLRRSATRSAQSWNCSSMRPEASSPSARLSTRSPPRRARSASSALAAALNRSAPYSRLPHPKTANFTFTRWSMPYRSSREDSRAHRQNHAADSGGTGSPPAPSYVEMRTRATGSRARSSGSYRARSATSSATPWRERRELASLCASRRAVPVCEPKRILPPTTAGGVGSGASGGAEKRAAEAGAGAEAGAIETAVAREEDASETTARRAGSVATPSPPADAREWDPPMATERATRRRPSES